MYLVAGDGTVVCDAVGWAWVTVSIGGTTYTFDPAAKLSGQTFSNLQNQYANVCSGSASQPTATGYVWKTGVNLATATGYTQSSFIASAETGATVTSTSVAGLNRANTRSNLTTYSTNLVSWIRSNAPAAATADIIGGQSIAPLPVGTYQRWASMPYQCTQTAYGCTASTSYTSLPSVFRTTLTVTLPGAGAVTFNSSDIYGHRLTVFANSANDPVLALDGTTEATGSALTPGSNLAISVAIVHPYQNGFANASGTLNIAAGSYYLIESGWGPVGRGMIEKHRKLLLQNQQANPGCPTAEPVMGESLSVLGYTWLGQLGQVMLTTGQVSGVQTLYQHAVGIVGIKTLDAGGDTAPYVDLPLNQFSVTQLSSRPDVSTATSLELSAFFTFFGIASVLESGTLEQTQPGLTAVSTVKLLDMASVGDTIYDINNSAVTGDNASYWTNTLKPLLSPNYGAADLARISSLVTTSNLRVIAAQHGNQTVNLWTGAGYLQLAQNSSSMGAIITGGLSGGDGTQAYSDASSVTGAASTDTNNSSASVPQTGNSVSETSGAAAMLGPIGGDPVNLVTGAYVNDHRDLTVGSVAFPYGLSFKRHYDSSSGYAAGPMGAGWTNNLTYSATQGSDGFSGMGASSPINGASAIAAIYVLQDIFNQGSAADKPVDRIVIAAQTQRWLMDQLTGNVVNVVQPGQVSQFVKLASLDGAAPSTYVYNAPFGANATLTYSGTAYGLTTADQKVLSFNSVGNIATLHDPAGPTVSFAYNSSNQLTSVANGMGRTLTLTYTGTLVTSVTDGTRSVSYAYDSNNDLTTYTDPAGNVVTYAYDQPGRMTQIFYPSFPTNAFVTTTYDSLGRASVQADADGNVTNIYLAGYRAEVDDPAGTADVNYLSPSGNTLIHIDGLGEQTTNVYDGIERLVSTTLPEGNSATYTYDNADGVLALQNVLSVTTTPTPSSGQSPITVHFTYDPTFQKLKTATDANGNVTTNTYDTSGGTGELLETQQPAVGGVTPTTTYTYNARGQVLTKTDPVGKVTAFTYDSATEELLTATDDNAHLQIKVQYAYDAVGNVLTTTDPNGNVTTKTYDLLRRVTQVTAPTSTAAVTVTTYNPDGMVTQVQQATGNTSAPWQTSSATYSHTGKKLTATDPNGNVTHYVYDALDRLSTVTDPVGRVTTFGYDVLGRQISVSNTAIQAAPLSAMTFTANGKKASFTDARNNTTTYVYDGFDRLAQTQYPSTTVPGSGVSDPTNYEAVTSYDANGSPLIVRRRDGTTVTMAYDVLGRPTVKSYSSGQSSVYYAYDLDGRALSALYGSTTGPGVTYVYDTAGRVSSETSSTASQSHTVTFQYDANGNRVKETWPDSFYVTYAYDALNRMTTVGENGATSGVGLLASYSYDPLSRRTGVARGNGTSTTYGYDAASRLTSLAQVMASGGTSGNVSWTLGYTNANQLSSQANSNDAYDWLNHPTATVSKTFDGLNRDATLVAASGYDAKGNVIQDQTQAAQTRTYTYDTDNKMTSVTIAATSTTATLSYDPLGRLQQDADVISGTASTTLFLYEGSRLSAEYDGSGNLLRRYVHGPGTDEPIVWYEGSGTTDRRWLHANAQGSIIAQSNASGVVTQTYAYGPYGEPTAWGGSRFAYTGQIALPEVQLYDYKARVYDPIAGRFLQTDPIGYAGGANLYAYVGDDPLDLADPLGRDASVICYHFAGCPSNFAQVQTLDTVANEYAKAALLTVGSGVLAGAAAATEVSAVVVTAIRGTSAGASVVVDTSAEAGVAATEGAESTTAVAEGGLPPAGEPPAPSSSVDPQSNFNPWTDTQEMTSPPSMEPRLVGGPGELADPVNTIPQAVAAGGILLGRRRNCRNL